MIFSYRTILIGFFAIVITSALLSGYLLLTQSIRLDEAQSIWMASKPLDALLSLTSQDVHVPLYNVLLHFWMQLFGNSIIAARSLSYLFFLLTLPALYIMAKNSSNRKIALVTVAFFSVSPFILWYTSEARMYTLFTFITAINQIFFLRFIRADGRSGKVGYFFSLLLGVYTHYFFLFLIATQGVFILLIIFMKANKERLRGRSLLRGIIMHNQLAFFFTSIMLAIGFCFLPWILYVVKSGGFANSSPLIPPPTSFNIFQTFVNFLFGFQPQGIQAMLVSLWPLIVIILFFIFTQKKRLPIMNLEYFILATFLPILLAFFTSFYRPIFLSRYLILVTPTLFFIMSWILLNYSRKISTYVITALLSVMLLLMLYQNISAQIPVKENYKGVAEYLDKNARPEDIIAISAPFTIYPIEYSYRGNTKIVTIPLWDRYSSGAIPAFSSDAFHSQVDSYKKQYARLFVVLSYDQGYEKTIRTYLDNHYQLLARKQFSVGLETSVYKLRYDI